MIAVDPKAVRKAGAFVEKLTGLVEEFGYVVPMAADDGTVFEFGVPDGGPTFAVVVVPNVEGFSLGLGTEA